MAVFMYKAYTVSRPTDLAQSVNDRMLCVDFVSSRVFVTSITVIIAKGFIYLLTDSTMAKVS
ncbi:hypothetical protein BWQ96_00823 [Gracilariopsis chorda]|uniref:Uncharacterized protein n=1 Tax=Gracilariopsis chorda TaxID=448386 RepID=A0A2V3J687_9FLOR|nr:hypothetical protein BWQ96_00823 [Gracilariopsis chorda]|eukprot:PXF49507.1 hypothetical protein BWQ96_00823 [Gracilariopsis chorda]